MRKRLPAEQQGEREKFTTKLTLLHVEAMRLGLYLTGHKIHDAVKQLGWERAEVERPL
jgi:hypothetical protein